MSMQIDFNGQDYPFAKYQNPGRAVCAPQLLCFQM